jgi:prepilin-type N-terminal cleavage/methylation domain-containing protein
MKVRIPSWSRDAGFSLIEMVIVLLCAGIMAAFTIPSLLVMRDNYNAVFAAQEISTHLHFAKLKAISSNESLRVNFGNNDSYQVELADGTRLQGPFPYPQGIKLNTAAGGGAVTFPGRFVTFQPDGTVPVAGNGSLGSVKLLSNNGLCVDILVGRGGVIRQTSPYR